MSNQLKRHITISKLLRTPDQLEFHDKHTLIYGIYDDQGLESISLCKDWDTEDGLNNLLEARNSYELRCLFNTSRNSVSFIRWITNEKLEHIQELVKRKDFLLSKSMIINESFPI